MICSHPQEVCLAAHAALASREPQVIDVTKASPACCVGIWLVGFGFNSGTAIVEAEWIGVLVKSLSARDGLCSSDASLRPARINAGGLMLPCHAFLFILSIHRYALIA